MPFLGNSPATPAKPQANGFFLDSPPTKNGKVSKVTTSSPATPAQTATVTNGKHHTPSKSLVPYDCDESDHESGETACRRAGAGAADDDQGGIKTKSGVWMEEPGGGAALSVSQRGSTQNCAAKSSSNSPTVEERAAERQSPVVSQLLKLSHQGYSGATVTWNGEKTALDKEVAQEKRDDRKRQREEDRDLDIDRGRQKKFKNVRPLENRPRSNHNLFQTYQDRENAHQQRDKWLANHVRRDRDSEFRDKHRHNNYFNRNGGGGGGGNGYNNHNKPKPYQNNNKNFKRSSASFHNNHKNYNNNRHQNYRDAYRRR